MEAPEKIYLYPDDRAGYEYEAEWGDKPWGEDSVEYTRTNVLIEKTADKLKQLMYDQHLFKGMMYQDAIIENFVENFKKYMKGE